MDAWKVGSLAVWGICMVVVGVGTSPTVFAQELHAQTVVPSSGHVVRPEIGVMSPAPQPVAAGAVRLAGMQDETDRGDRLLAVVLPPRRSGFERLRRILPYGVVHDPVIRYLTDDQLNVPEDY